MSGFVGTLIDRASMAMQLAAFFDGADDPWARFQTDCQPHAFGRGSRRAFGEYFQGESRVPVRSVEDVCAWLRGCECLTDDALFLESDYWQHPVTFEHLRKGDCEDHALWAWRKLTDLGLPTLLLAGRWRDRCHAWVVFQLDATDHLLEATSKDASMIRPLTAVRSEYCPALGVDHELRTWVYQGYRSFHLAEEARGRDSA